MAFVRSHTLQSMSRLIAESTANDSYDDIGDNTRYVLCFSAITLVNALSCCAWSAEFTTGSGSSSNSDSRDGGGCRQQRALQRELSAALAESQLLEHVMRWAAKVPLTLDTGSQLATKTILVLGNVAVRGGFLRPPVPHGLPGPCAEFVTTAMVVEVLRSWDGGTFYGLTPEAQSQLQGSVLGPPGTLSLAADHDGFPTNLLDSWLALMAPESEPAPRVSLFSPGAVTEICLRISSCCLDAAIAAGQPSGGGGAGASSSGTSSISGAGTTTAGKSGGDGGQGVGNSCGIGKCCKRAHRSPARGAGRVRSAPSLSPAALEHRRRCLCISVKALVGADAIAERLRSNEQAGANAASAAAPASVSAPGTAAPAEVQRTAALPGGAAHVRSRRWWGEVVRALDVMARLPPAATDVELFARKLVGRMFSSGQLALDLPGEALLPEQALPDVAKAVNAGLLPALEGLVRRSAVPGASLTLSWPALGWLLAYGEPRQAAALVDALVEVQRATNGAELGLGLLMVNVNAMNWSNASHKGMTAAEAEAETRASAAAAAARRPAAAAAAAAGEGGRRGGEAGGSGGGDGGGGGGGDTGGSGAKGSGSDVVSGPTVQLRTLVGMASERIKHPLRSEARAPTAGAAAGVDTSRRR